MNNKTTASLRLETVLNVERPDRLPCICPGGMMNMMTAQLPDVPSEPVISVRPVCMKKPDLENGWTLCEALEGLSENGKNMSLPLLQKLPGLMDMDFCDAENWYSENCERYGEALSALYSSGQGGLVGHFCLNFLDAKRPYLKRIKFK